MLYPLYNRDNVLLCLTSHNWDLGKQCRPRSDATKCSTASDQGLMGNIKVNQTPLPKKNSLMKKNTGIPLSGMPLEFHWYISMANIGIPLECQSYSTDIPVEYH